MTEPTGVAAIRASFSLSIPTEDNANIRNCSRNCSNRHVSCILPRIWRRKKTRKDHNRRDLEMEKGRTPQPLTGKRRTWRRGPGRAETTNCRISALREDEPDDNARNFREMRLYRRLYIPGATTRYTPFECTSQEQQQRRRRPRTRHKSAAKMAIIGDDDERTCRGRVYLPTDSKTHRTTRDGSFVRSSRYKREDYDTRRRRTRPELQVSLHRGRCGYYAFGFIITVHTHVHRRRLHWILAGKREMLRPRTIIDDGD